VKKAALDLIKIVGDPSRVFDVGLRSAICPQQHEIVLEALSGTGIKRTSNVAGAKVLGLKPVGTMGHEHPQRFRQDELAFRAVKERRPFKSSFLTDTFSSFQSGIPAALRIIAEDPEAHDSMRYDSEDKRGDYIYAVSSAKRMQLDPTHIIESELDLEETAKFEELRKALEVAPERQFYGYGKYFVSDTAFGKLTRDRVSAVYKLSQTGPWPTMKFSRHKESLPGRPILFRRTSGSGPAGIVGQEGEACPQGYVLVSGTQRGERLELDSDIARQLELCERQDGAYAIWSPATNALRDRVKRDVEKTMNESRIEDLAGR
jgi:nicotinic acid phosphoribosyltransferase